MSLRDREPQLFADIERLKEAGNAESYDKLIAVLEEYVRLEELAASPNPPEDLPAQTEKLFKEFKQAYIEALMNMEIPSSFTFKKP